MLPLSRTEKALSPSALSQAGSTTSSQTDSNFIFIVAWKGMRNVLVLGRSCGKCPFRHPLIVIVRRRHCIVKNVNIIIIMSVMVSGRGDKR